MKSSRTLWSRSPDLRRFPPVDADHHAEVIVLGGGVTGVTTALLLAEAGKNVTLLESRSLASGVTGATTAHLTEALDTRYHELESSFGKEGSALARASTREAIEKIGELAAAGGGDGGFRRLDGYLFAEETGQLSELEAELAAANRAGAEVTRAQQVPLPFATRGGIVFARQAQIHPTVYLRQLVERLALTNARIFEGTTASHVEPKGQLRVETDTGHQLTADAVVLATHAPFQTYTMEFQLTQYRSYVVSAPIQQPLPGLFWDLADPYHYLRSTTIDGSEYVVIGGGDHRTGTLPEGGPDAPFRELEAYAQRFGSVVSERWSSQVVEPSDGLPFIGKPDADVEIYLAQGFSGNGMTFGTLASMMISDALLGRENRYAQLYRADRLKPLASAKAVIAENAETVAHFVSGHVKPVADKPIQEVARGEGCILKIEGKRLAVYRDDEGALHSVSAICSHQGCQVAFNPIERSWDCPCHGSRFDVDGRLLDGPAEKPLEPHPIADA